MKPSPGALVATLALSLAVWAYFYVSPGTPLDASETAVVVGVCAVVVFLARRAWVRLRGARGDRGPSA